MWDARPEAIIEVVLRLASVGRVQAPAVVSATSGAVFMLRAYHLSCQCQYYMLTWSLFLVSLGHAEASEVNVPQGPTEAPAVRAAPTPAGAGAPTPDLGSCGVPGLAAGVMDALDTPTGSAGGPEPKGRRGWESDLPRRLSWVCGSGEGWGEEASPAVRSRSAAPVNQATSRTSTFRVDGLILFG